MTVARLRKNLPLMQLLLKKLKGKNNIKDFHAIIDCLSEKTLEFLAECVQNGVNPDFVRKIPDEARVKYLKKISPYKKEIKKVVKKNLNFKRKKKIIQKGSGWFLPILSAVVPLISELIFKK
jgi:hypothetical protein